jgi:rubredoxin
LLFVKSDDFPTAISQFWYYVASLKLLKRVLKMKKWQCLICGYIYDESKGIPEEGIEPGTSWEDIPEDWVCPDCGVGKDDFEMIEI